MSIRRLTVLGFFLAFLGACRPSGSDEDFLKTLPQNKEYPVRLDLSQPGDYSGIPVVPWLGLGPAEYCAIQGTVAADIKLPDGKRLSGNFHMFYIFRDANGIFRVCANSPVEGLTTNMALTRLDCELRDWAADVYSPEQYAKRKESISTWLTSWPGFTEMSKGFNVRRAGYELFFNFYTLSGPQRDGCQFRYEIRLRNPGSRELIPARGR